jgi:hypothetical protein
MIKLDDPIWETFLGGYRTPYNASVRLQELENGTNDLDEVWQEFWEELHHQGDVDIASYAAVPHLVRICVALEILDWNVFALVACIEECRRFNENPSTPKWLEEDYLSAIKSLAAFGASNFSKDWSQDLTRAFLSIAAFAKDCPNTGRILAEFSDDEMNDVFNKFFE